MFNDSMKLLMNWDIKPGRDQEYFEFVVREWVPGINKLGIENIAAWYTLYSRENSAAQIMAEAIAEDPETMREMLLSDEWAALQDRLKEYVNNYEQKVVRVSGDFQM